MLAATGCVVGDESEPGSGATEPTDPTDPTGKDPIPSNGLIFDPMLAQQLPPAGLGARAADGTVTLSASAASIFDNEGGQALMKYVAICALPQGQAIALGGKRLAGYYGLAPQWATGACDESCQRWVSACLLAHANQRGTPVPISLHGDRPDAFAAETQALASFTFQEAAFYGNVMRGELYACVGDGPLGQIGTAVPDTTHYIEGRVCGLGACGITGTGTCNSIVAGVSDGACDRAAGPGQAFADCHTQAYRDGVPQSSAIYHEVITVYLQP